MSNEEVIQEVTKDMLANGRYFTTMFVCGTKRTERVLLSGNPDDAEELYPNTALAGYNLAFSIGVNEKKPIGEIEKLFFVEHGSLGRKPNETEAIRIDCFEGKEKKNSISVLRVVRDKHKTLKRIEPFMLPENKGPLIYKIPSSPPNPLLEAFMRGYADGCAVFEKQ